MSKHSDRIWRTVVFAGAMLAAPVVSADTPAKAKPAKPVPKAPDTLASVTRELADVEKKIELTSAALAGAKSATERRAAKAKLEGYQKQKADLERKRAALVPQTPITRLERELADVNARLEKQMDVVIAAQNDADRAAAKAKLAPLQRERADVERRLAEERQKAADKARPRTKDSDRPIGRGFVLA